MNREPQCSEPQDRPTARVTQEIHASPESVFDAWLTPDQVRTWMGNAVSKVAEGDMRRVEIDARPGGRFTFSDMRGVTEAIHTGSYLEIARPRRLVFTWLPEQSDHSVVTVDITPTAEGCRLDLAHEMDHAWADAVEQTTTGWSAMVSEIAKLTAQA